MSDRINEDFEGGIAGYGQTGSPTTASGDAMSGTTALDINGTGASKYIQATFAANLRQAVVRIYFKPVATPGGANDIYRHLNANGDMKLSLDAALKITPILNTTAGTTSSNAAILNVWNLLEALLDSHASPALIDFRLNGIPGTQHSRVQAAADQGFARLGCIGSNTLHNLYDLWRVTDVAADYPLGPLIRPRTFLVGV